MTKSGWWLGLAVATLYTVSGLLDEAVGEADGAQRPLVRWFCEANLYCTLPLIASLLISYLSFLKHDLPASTGETQLQILFATALVGTCYAMFGATVGHELTHKLHPFAQFSARSLFAFMGNSSFMIFHVHHHHRYVGTERDPATARRGENIFSFCVRTVVGQYDLAQRYEFARLSSAGLSPWSLRNRLITGHTISICIVIASAVIAGSNGVIGVLAAAVVGRTLHEFINYVQHFGLVRIEGTPVAARHSWDCNRTISNLLYYNLPRHSEHHLFASRPFWQLKQGDQPRLPYGYSTMVLLALIPAVWRRVMDPLLAEWDARLASDPERKLISGATAKVC